jgi:hypothetical protein
MLIPLQTLPKLKLSFQKKLSLLLLFTLGFFAIVASIVRTILFIKDATLAKVVVWSFVEETVFFVVANGPILRPLFFRTFESRSGGSGRGTRGYDLMEGSGVVSVVSAGGKTGVDSGHGVIRTVEVIVSSEERGREDGQGAWRV